MELKSSGSEERAIRRVRDKFVRELFEEHIEELAILWRLRSQRVGSPEHRLVELIRLDERIDAHADAIAAAGDGVRQLLAPGLESSDGADVFASAYSVLRAGLDSLMPSLREFFGEVAAADDAIRGLRDALAHAPGSAWRGVLERYSYRPDRAGAVAAEIFAFHGELDLAGLLFPQVVLHEEGESRAYAWRAAAHGVPVPADVWARGFEDSSTSIRSLAFEAAAWQGQSLVREHLRDLARASVPDEVALVVFAWLAEEDDYGSVLQAIERLPKMSQQARILGALGLPSAIPRLIDMLAASDPRTAAASSLALTRITGWDVDSESRVTLTPEDAPPGDEVAEAFDEVFVLPDCDRARAQWKEEQHWFETGVRWSRGIDVGGGLPRDGLRNLDLESVRSCCLRARLRGTTVWNAARLGAFPQPRV